MAMGMTGRVAGCALAALQVVSCYGPGAFDDFVTAADDYASSSSSSSGAESGDTPLTSTVTGMAGESSSGDVGTTGGGSGSGGDDTGAQVDLPPEIVQVTINGVDDLVKVDSASEIEFAAVAVDDHAIASVEFLLDGQSIGVDTEAPYEASLVVHSDTWNGERTLTVIARDSVDQEDSEASPLVIMLPVSGSMQWQWYDETYRGKGLDVVVGPEGDVYVVGYRNFGPDPTLTRMDIRKFNAEGGHVWDRVYPTDVPKGTNIAYGVGVDVSGNLLVVGDVDLDGSSPRSALVTYTAGGALLGAKLGQLDDHARDISVGPDGAFVVAGFREKQLSSDAMFWGYNAVAKPEWTFPFHPEWSVKNIANGVIHGEDGQIFAGGVMTDSNDVEFGFVLQVKEGSYGWYRTTSKVDTLDDVGHDVAIDRDGNVVMVGQHKKTSDALWMIRVDAKSGDMLGTFTDPALRCGSIGCGIASDGLGNLLVAGAALQVKTGIDAAVKKIDDTWLATYWESLESGYDLGGEDRSVAVTAGPFGAVYTAGFKTRDGVDHLWVAGMNP